MKSPERIASFSVDHDVIDAGIYISRVDGDVTTYDLRTRKPNMGEYMDNLTMHSVEHMFATYIRSSAIGDSVLYFGPMGCQTGFYLLVRNADDILVVKTVIETLEKIAYESDRMFGGERRECGNYKNLDLSAAKRECLYYLSVLKNKNNTLAYGE